MAKEFLLPDLGEGIHEAQVLNLKIKEGDTVKEDQMIMEVETDKAAVEIPVPFSGVVSKLYVQQGQTVKVGQPLLAVDGGGAPAPSKASPPAAAASRPAPAVRAEASRPAPQRAPAPQAPVRPIHAQIGESVSAPRPAPAPARIAAEAPARRGATPIPAAPAIRRLAREMNVDLGEVHGTGPGGRIVREDLERYRIAGPTGTGVGPARSEPAPAPRLAPTVSDDGARPSAPSDSLPDFSQWGPIRREPITQIRKTIARQMVRSYTLIPHVTHCDTADVTDLESFRKQHGEVFNEKGTKLTLTTFIVKAVAGALQQFPQLNCSFDDQANEIVYKDYVHIGIAVDTPRGLVVPVIRDCDRKSLLRITKDLNDVAERARAAKFDIAELRGGTFTITNVGPLGGTFVTPMINYPEVAILGLGRMSRQAVVRNDQIVPRMILPLSLSFDHRVIDGADAARFVRSIIGYLENPLNLLMVS